MSGVNFNDRDKKAVGQGDDASTGKIQSPNLDFSPFANATVTIADNDFSPGDKLTITGPAISEKFEAEVEFTPDGQYAQDNIEFSANPSPGDQITLTVEGVPYVFVADTDFTIGVDAAETSYSLRDAINNTPVLQDLILAGSFA